MKTLYIDINNEKIQSNDELEVLNYDLDSDFFFYLGEKIAKGCKVENENALITDFNTKDNEEDYRQIITQWNEIKAVLFSEECEGKIEFTLPNGYIHWLRYSEKYNHVYDKNFSQGESAVITIDLEDLYEDSIEELQRKILRKLQRDDLYLEIDEIVFIDDAVTHKSSIIRTIKGFNNNIGFKSYKKWLQEKDNKLKESQVLLPSVVIPIQPCLSQIEETIPPLNSLTIDSMSDSDIQNNEEFYYYYLVKERIKKNRCNFRIRKEEKSEILKAIRMYLNKTTDCINVLNSYREESIYRGPKSPFYGGGSSYKINIDILDKYRLNFFLSICKTDIWNEDQKIEIYSQISSLHFPVGSSCVQEIKIPTHSPFNKRYKTYITKRWNIYTYNDGSLKAKEIIE